MSNEALAVSGKVSEGNRGIGLIGTDLVPSQEEGLQEVLEIVFWVLEAICF
jgi:hypothetical protein